MHETGLRRVRPGQKRTPDFWHLLSGIIAWKCDSREIIHGKSTVGTTRAVGSSRKRGA
jgi:hypothetical protein